MQSSSSASETNTGCKIDHIREKYGLSELDTHLVQKRQDDDPMSLRELETLVNTMVVRAVLQDGGRVGQEGEAKYYYQLLMDDESNAFARQEAVTKLEQEGVDVDELLNDFVSYQTVRRHLNECLDVSTSRYDDYEPNTDEILNVFGALKARVVNVVSRHVDKLRTYEKLDIEDPEIRVSIEIQCGNCGRTSPVTEILRRGNCHCHDQSLEE